MAKRAGATTKEINSSHISMISHPRVVAEMIEAAAKATGLGGHRIAPAFMNPMNKLFGTRADRAATVGDRFWGRILLARCLVRQRASYARLLLIHVSQ